MPKQYQTKFMAIAGAIALVILSPLAAQARGCHGGGGHCHSGGFHCHISHGHYHNYHYHNNHGGGGYGGYDGPYYGATGGYLWGSGSGGGAYRPMLSDDDRFNASEDARRRSLPDTAFVQNFSYDENANTSNGLTIAPAHLPNNYYTGSGYSTSINNAASTYPNSTVNQNGAVRSVQGIVLPYEGTGIRDY